ncbi:hypothetical protein HaLaN_03150 [Haematococcus lacustris]|uniref:Uncharacterized protein n=1 Tax=Haematococcus lacustris TaxID=44745 RepID=A0A699YDI7_HAELA|nr:hypothetical protein HaLaN_03150 [Haematococcus lacustris]
MAHASAALLDTLVGTQCSTASALLSSATLWPRPCVESPTAHHQPLWPNRPLVLLDSPAWLKTAQARGPGSISCMRWLLRQPRKLQRPASDLASSMLACPCAQL